MSARCGCVIIVSVEPAPEPDADVSLEETAKGVTERTDSAQGSSLATSARLEDVIEPLNISELTGLSTGGFFSPEFMESITASMAPQWEAMGLSVSLSPIVNDATRVMASQSGLFDSSALIAAQTQRVISSAIGATAWIENVPDIFGLTGVASGLLPSSIYESFIPRVEMPDFGLLLPIPSILLGLDVDGLIRGLRSRPVPPNWLDVELDPDDAENDVRGILEDGIPLGWVPNATVIQRLLDAQDRAARRRVISNNWRGILNDCEEIAGELPAPRAFFLADMVRSAIRAIRDGHTEAGQALATNVLDTTVSQYSASELQLNKGSILDPERQDWLVGHGWRIALSLLAVNASMAGRFELDHRGSSFHRNITAHAATRRQYNRINAVIAVMLATSTLACYVRDTSAFD